MNKLNFLSSPGSIREMGVFILTFMVMIVLIYMMIHQLAGCLVAAGLAYLFLPLVRCLSNLKITHGMGIGIVMVLMIGTTLFLIGVPLPFVGQQLISFIQSLPDMIDSAQAIVSHMPQYFPDYINSAQMDHLTSQVQSWVTSASSSGFSFFMLLIPSILSLIMYLFLVPLLVFSFLKTIIL